MASFHSVDSNKSAWLLAKIRVKMKREKEAKDRLEFHAAQQIQKIMWDLGDSAFSGLKDEAFLRQRRGRVWKYLEIAQVVKIFHAKGDHKKRVNGRSCTRNSSVDRDDFALRCGQGQ